MVKLQMKQKSFYRLREEANRPLTEQPISLLCVTKPIYYVVRDKISWVLSFAFQTKLKNPKNNPRVFDKRKYIFLPFLQVEIEQKSIYWLSL